jgi:hypothetical protein
MKEPNFRFGYVNVREAVLLGSRGRVLIPFGRGAPTGAAGIQVHVT